MKKLQLHKFLVGGLLACSLLSACKKDEVGYLSDELYYELSPMVIPKGWEYRGIGINPDGSTRPMQFKLLHVYEKSTGKNVDDIFMTKRPLRVWKSALNFATDTTRELLANKMGTAEGYAVNIEPASGQVYTNYATEDLPSGHYTFDLEISNSKGSKVHEKFGEFILVDTVAFQDVKAMGGAISNGLMKKDQESVTKSGVLPTVNITYEEAETSTLTVYFLDKNGDAFNPKKGEVTLRPSGETFLQNFSTYTVRPDVYDDRMEFFIAQFPFPLQSAGNGYNIYYRIQADAIVYDDPSKNGFHSNPRTIQRLQKQGKYTLTVQFTDLVRKPM